MAVTAPTTAARRMRPPIKKAVEHEVPADPRVAATATPNAAIPNAIAADDATTLTNQAWATLEAEAVGLGLPDLKTQTLPDFLASAEQTKMSAADKATIVDQALLIFQNLYPHLPFKKQIYDFAHPVESLTQVRANLTSEMSGTTPPIGETAFHSSVIMAFDFVVDAHTVYGLPPPYRGSVAFLPFLMRAYWDQNGFPRFVVTKMMKAQADGGFGHPTFVPGAEITHWNADPTEVYIENSLGRMPGGNEHARVARGTAFATMRPLTFCEPPNEGWMVTLRYNPPGTAAGLGPTHAIQLPWGVVTGLGARTSLPGSAFSVSVPTAELSAASHAIVPGGATSSTSTLPNVFDFQFTAGTLEDGTLDPAILHDVGHPDAKFGYIQIRNFGGALGQGDAIVQEFKRILGIMNTNAPDGLVLDIRSNPGGDVQAAERMLGMLAAEPITPAQFHLANTPVIQQILRQLQQESKNEAALTAQQDVQLTDARADLQAWIDDVDVSAASQDVLTTGHPLTPNTLANEAGQVYRGLCTLLVDAMSYSAADIFAAGFQDHAIGQIIGVESGTGGGGANVWTHDDLLDKFPSGPDLPLAPLPPQVTMSLAIRRSSRVGPNVGQPVEDVGVMADLQYLPASPADLLDGFTDVVTHACRLLGANRSFRVDVHEAVLGNGVVNIDLQTTNVDSLIFYLDFMPAHSSPAVAGSRQTFAVPVAAGDTNPGEITIEGYAMLPGADGMESLLVVTSGPHPVEVGP